MDFNFLLFAALTIVALIGAVGVIVSRNAVYSALYLLLNFATIAGMYIMLGAQFLGMVQIIVYAGAIVVLFLFVVMLIGGEISAVRSGTRRYTRAAAVILVALFLAAIILVIGRSVPTSLPAQGAPTAGSVQAVGATLYTTYLLPFELASVLLLAGMLGGVVLARRYIPFQSPREE